MYNDSKQEILPKLEDEIDLMYRFINEYKQAIEEMYKSLTVNNQSEMPGKFDSLYSKNERRNKRA